MEEMTSEVQSFVAGNQVYCVRSFQEDVEVSHYCYSDQSNWFSFKWKNIGDNYLIIYILKRTEKRDSNMMDLC